MSKKSKMKKHCQTVLSFMISDIVVFFSAGLSDELAPPSISFSSSGEILLASEGLSGTYLQSRINTSIPGTKRLRYTTLQPQTNMRATAKSGVIAGPTEFDASITAFAVALSRGGNHIDIPL